MSHPKKLKQPATSFYAPVLKQTGSASRPSLGRRTKSLVDKTGVDGEILTGAPFSQLKGHDYAGLKDDFDAMRRICDKLRMTESLYEDPDFNGMKSIYKHPENPGLCKKFMNVAPDEIEFLRPSEMKRGDEMALYVDGIEPNDISQGQLGNCYFLAALASACAKDNLVLELLIDDFSAYGMYGVKFFTHQGWVTVVVDDRFPCKKGTGLPIFAQPCDGIELWVMVFEKAWAKLHGTFQAIDGGNAADTLVYLTGGHHEPYVLDDPAIAKMIASGRLFDELANLKEETSFICVSGKHKSATMRRMDSIKKAKDAGQGGLVADHAYTMLKAVHVTSKNLQLVQLRNPWGDFEWDGDWGDSSPLWTDEMKSLVDYVDRDDGVFWMCWTDFLAHFSNISVVKTVEPSCPLIHTVGQWIPGRTSGGSEDDTWMYNPRYYLTVKTKGMCHISMAQPDTRNCAGCLPDAGNLEVNIRIFKQENDFEKTGEVELNEEIARHSIHVRRGTLAVTLEPGQYVILPSLGVRGFGATFGITVETEHGDATLQHLAPQVVPEDKKEVLKSHVSPYCAKCEQPCAIGPTDYFYLGMRWHADCYRCAECDEGFGSTPKVHDRNGKPEGFCQNCESKLFSDKCLDCRADIHGNFYQFPDGKVHQACLDSYTSKTALVCSHCKKAVTDQYVTFEGKTPEGKQIDEVILHEECYDPFVGSIAPTCAQCGKVVTTAFYTEGDDIVHADPECWDAYEATHASVCLACGEAVLDDFFDVDGGEVHATGTCYKDWKAKNKKK